MPQNLTLATAITDADFHQRAIEAFWLTAALVAGLVIEAVEVFSPN